MQHFFINIADFILFNLIDIYNNNSNLSINLQFMDEPYQ